MKRLVSTMLTLALTSLSALTAEAQVATGHPALKTRERAQCFSTHGYGAIRYGAGIGDVLATLGDPHHMRTFDDGSIYLNYLAEGVSVLVKNGRAQTIFLYQQSSSEQRFSAFRGRSVARSSSMQIATRKSSRGWELPTRKTSATGSSTTPNAEASPTTSTSTPVK